MLLPIALGLGALVLAWRVLRTDETKGALADTLPKKGTSKGKSKRKPTAPSPVPGISDAQWSDFALKFGQSKLDIIDENGHLGMFRLNPKRLEELGLMHAVKKGKWRGKDGVWQGTFTAPVTAPMFFNDPKLQYQTFVRDMREHARYAIGHYRSWIGKRVDGEKVTLSGLLGVAKIAGDVGLGKWLGSAKDRKKFKLTTATFSRTNGIF